LLIDGFWGWATPNVQPKSDNLLPTRVGSAHMNLAVVGDEQYLVFRRSRNLSVENKLSNFFSA